MLPIISIVGQSQSGKTTLVEQLVIEFKGRGYRVATVKHTCKDFDIDKKGKDTWRYTEAGSDAVAISAPRMVALIKPQDGNDSIDEVVHLLGEDFDIIFIEGFHQAHVPKIEVYRKELNKGLRCDPGELKAIVSDDTLDVDVPQFPVHDISGIADFISERIIGKRGDDTLLFVNGSPIILNQFANQIFANTLLGMVSSLKGVTEVRSLEVAVRKKGI
jgi:molybdopterin-guanine dinucleotide biosynthesis protein B